MRILTRGGPYVLSLAIAALIMTEIYEHATNTLANNGRWTVTKAEIERSVGFGHHFDDMRVTLRRDRLDLGAWQSPHEIIYKQPVPIERIQFDSLLTNKSYLAVEFNRDPSSFWALRLSRSPLFPPALLKVDLSGKFLSRTVLDLPKIRPGWNRYEIVQKNGILSVLMNGEQIFQAPFQGDRIQQFGFRNGRKSVLLDNIKVTAPGGETVATETFKNIRQYGWVFLGSIGFLILVNLLIHLSARAPGGRIIVVRLLSANLLIIFCLTAYFAADWYRLSSIVHYPGEPVLSIFKWPQFITEASSDESPERHPGVSRILFLGSSQTFGEGANKESDCWVNLIQQKFDALKTRARNECINAGLPGRRSDELVPELRSRWSKKSPNLVVVDLSTNDGNKETFEKSLKEIVALDNQMGAKTLFILEPNDQETTDVIVNTENNHRVMREIGAYENVPVIDLHAYLNSPSVYDTGFLWWDYVHLTSYGQSLFANHLFPILEKIKISSN